MMKLTIVLAGLSFSLFSHACVCSDFEILPQVSDKHLDQSEFQLFTGKILLIETLTQPFYADTANLSDYQKSQTRSFQRITIAVITSYGNQVMADTIQIATGKGGGDCGVTFFKENEKYLFTVGAKPADAPYFWTSICVPNRELKHAKEEIRFIENNQF